MIGDIWTQKADMPTARYIPGSAVVDGKIYVIGGAPFQFGGTTVVEEYNPATDTWMTRADMPTARQGVRAAAVDGIIYAIGGNCGQPIGDRTLSTVEAYDPATDTWTTKADMPTARAFSAIAVVDGQIYVVGGSLNGTALSVVEAYDPATDTWTQTFDMPRSRTVHSASVVAGKMYIVGGVDLSIIKLFEEGKIEEGKAKELLSTVDVYDPATDTWTAAADHPTTIAAHTAAVVDGKIYTIGGGWGPPGPEAPVFSTVYEYDPGLPGAIPSAR